MYSYITSIYITLSKSAKQLLTTKTQNKMETKQSYPIVHSHESKLFTIVEKEENKVIITIGNTVASSKEFKNVKDATNYIAKKPWELLVNTMCIVNLKMKENETSN